MRFCISSVTLTIKPLINFGGDIKGLVAPTQFLPRTYNFVFTQWGAMTPRSTCLVRCPIANFGLTTNEGWLVTVRTGCFKRSCNCRMIVAVNCRNNLPAVCFKSFWGVIGKPAFNGTIDGDAIVVVYTNQFAQPEGSRSGSHLVGNTFHQTTVPSKYIREMVDDIERTSID